MGYTIEINTGADLVTLDANLKFDISFQGGNLTDGTANRTETFVEVEGEVVGASAEAVIDEIVELSREVRTTVRPRRVRILLDGTEKYLFEVGQSIASPVITGFRAQSEDDGGESHFKWSMSIYILQSGRRQHLGQDIIDLNTSVEETSVDEEVTRKVWRATATARTVQLAETKVRSYKPAVFGITEVIELAEQEARATATWTWEAGVGGQDQLEGFIQIVEVVEITDDGSDYAVDTQVGPADVATPPALLHRKPLGAAMITIRGTVKGREPGSLTRPGPHFAETPTMVRAFAREVTGDVVPDGEEATISGLYRLDYTEVWLSTAAVQPPNHGDHQRILFPQPPPNGNIIGL